MAVKHTPGPWTVWADEKSAVAVMPAMRRGDICILDGCMTLNARTANARLIAAAPDLLEALEEFSREYDGFQDGDGAPCPTLAKARAAIAKATARAQ